ncbi:hypothetical protein RFI_32679 [Reticulomyxa filosa]|uniref:Uncharacterized protein n=1 Tax=Reticulomyxa filosa TaxID=46433 RepID=X6LU96_RETFI|nr:hypothetical protein RFI_32679 [Reticulomyxa filosa]|eukprot:ETO04717.1 hypothetical protein RFI_32679 [Reticulomyxa filosa]
MIGSIDSNAFERRLKLKEHCLFLCFFLNISANGGTSNSEDDFARKSHWTMRNELTTKKKNQTTAWMSEDFENVHIESLTRILKLLQMLKQKRAPILFDEILSMKQKYLAISTLQQKVMDKQYYFDNCINFVRFNMTKESTNHYKKVLHFRHLYIHQVKKAMFHYLYQL